MTRREGPCSEQRPADWSGRGSWRARHTRLSRSLGQARPLTWLKQGHSLDQEQDARPLYRGEQ